MAKLFFRIIKSKRLIAVAAGILLVMIIGRADIWLSDLLYQNVLGNRWKYFENPLWHFMYRYGGAPAIAIFVCSCSLLITSFFSVGIKKIRTRLIYIIMAMALSQFVLVEGIKNTWGRPRPGEIKKFGGIYDYVPPLVPNLRLAGNKNDGKSFPSSHVSAALLPAVLYFVLRKRYKKTALASLAFGISNGLLMGLTRMIQGAHYVSDVAASFVIVFLTAILMQSENSDIEKR